MRAGPADDRGSRCLTAVSLAPPFAAGLARAASAFGWSVASVTGAYLVGLGLQLLRAECSSAGWSIGAPTGRTGGRQKVLDADADPGRN